MHTSTRIIDIDNLNYELVGWIYCSQINAYFCDTHRHEPQLSEPFRHLPTHILSIFCFCYFRENGSTQDLTENSNDGNREIKRKQAEVVSEALCANKMQKNVQWDQESCPSNSNSSHRQPKREKLDWSVLRPPKGQKKGE